ncbi:MAG: hypothetical protein IPQ13_13865 [Holophagaceae bacterium]|nr:hypothetical protein [Holophagaceae bacterium]
MQDIPNKNEQIFVSTLLSDINGKTSSILDAFSGWLVAGFGAASVVLVSQYESIAKHLGVEAIHQFLILFLCSLAIGVIEKYLFVGITSNSQGFAVGFDLGEKAKAKSITLDFEIINAEVSKSVLPPMRWLVTNSISKVTNGDLISSTRSFTRLLQIQGFLALAQALLIMVAIFKIAFGFHA